jgi:uncharacterized cupin superfamily protein
METTVRLALQDPPDRQGLPARLVLTVPLLAQQDQPDHKDPQDQQDQPVLMETMAAQDQPDQLAHKALLETTVEQVQQDPRVRQGRLVHQDRQQETSTAIWFSTPKAQTATV